MKFLLIAGSPNSLINFRGHLLDALVASGLEVHAASPDLSSNSTVRYQLEEKGVHVHDIYINRTGINPLSDIKTFLGLLLLIWQIKPDYVLGYTIKPVIYGSLAAAFVRVPNRYALITGLGYSFSDQLGSSQKQRFVRNLVERLYRLGLRKSRKVFFQNPDDEALFREYRIIDLKVPSIVVNGSGVDTQHFAPQPLPDSPRFLLIARLLADKGIREFVDAAYIIKKTYPHVVFTLVGDIDINPKSITRKELDGWIKEGRIDYLGKLKDVRMAIAGASVFVLPSFYREGVPRTILEALSMGRAVITTDTPGCRETVIEGVNGYLVPIKNAESLADAMKSFIEQPRNIEKMGRRSREIAEQKYDVHKVNGVMLKEMGII
ncbi:glycosyltransferase family 4 protein [Halomonas sp. ATCH28]|uniref:Glycosyltransferase family 4 protein n=1 Tax=Halomonas gemina TaxID=2945105 RepID=A0ABT0T5Z7_9GAMM|nr:glycosyltransferase family 4 protein [Halomonas gemina]MCL7942311.1 glycosyltransferase family 4 protein [Halomonas gemina]